MREIETEIRFVKLLFIFEVPEYDSMNNKYDNTLGNCLNDKNYGKDILIE